MVAAVTAAEKITGGLVDWSSDIGSGVIMWTPDTTLSAEASRRSTKNGMATGSAASTYRPVVVKRLPDMAVHVIYTDFIASTYDVS